MLNMTVLHSQAEIRQRMNELAAQISADYADVTPEQPLLALCTLRGAVFFAADLTRALTIPCELDFLRVHSYEGMRPGGAPVFDLGEQLEVRGRRVLILEDIVDTGQTMQMVLRTFSDRGAADIQVCTLLDKPARRTVPELSLRYVGFSIPDAFVVGWGLDYNGRYRLLPDLMAVTAETTATEKE